MGASNTKQKVFEFDVFQLDRWILRCRGERVPLQPKAIDTLYALVENAGSVVDKEDLMERVWPDTYVVESSLQRNISVLRKALEAHGAPGPYIETIARRGYCFVREVTVHDRGLSPGGSSDGRKSGEASTPATLEPRTVVTEAAVPQPQPISRRVWAVAIAAALAVLAGIAIYASRPTGEPEPPAPFQIGTHLLGKRTPDDARRAVDWFQRAIVSNPDDAEAHAALAQSYLMLSSMGSSVPGDIGRARAAAERALELDSKSVYAHAALGQIHLFHDHDLPKADEALATAVNLDPDSEISLLHYGRLLYARGETDEALAAFDRLQQLNPIAVVAGVEKARVYYSRHEFERAATELREVLEIERTDTLANYYLALCLGFSGQFELAEEHLERADLHPEVLRTDRAWLALQAGDPEPMRTIYVELTERVEEGVLNPIANLLPAVSLGELEYAIWALEETLPSGDHGLISMDVDPRLDALHGHPRYVEIIAELGVRKRPAQ